MKPSYGKIHEAANRIEPRLAKAVKNAADRVRERIPFREIEDALWRKDVRTVKALLNNVDVADAYQPSAAIVEDAVITGGKIASG